MKKLSIAFKIGVLLLALGLLNTSEKPPQEFQGQAFYFSKTKMNLGRWGARMSEAQKKQMAARMKNQLEKNYVLSFNKEESVFYEEEVLDAMSGATNSWGKNFSAGKSYKNVKTNTQIQEQEFYGKQFLVKDSLQKIQWVMGSETKQIGNYMCFKAIATLPTEELNWYTFSWSEMRQKQRFEKEADSLRAIGEEPEVQIAMTTIEAWYTPQIPVSHGPLEYWGLPGLILEVSAGDTVMLCNKIVINPEETIEIQAPKKGTEITKKKYKETIVSKMEEFAANRGRRRG
jgi:GLPGLI family protein